MYNYKIKLHYEGTRYNGWQKQGNTANTIQGLLEDILLNITGMAAEVTGSGRTDAGTHARGQTANFKLTALWDTKELMDRLNANLPSDIAVVECIIAEERFHSRLNAVGKVYTYRLSEGKADVFSRRTVFQLEDTLDIEKMKRAAELFVGKRDFRGFSSDKRKKKSTVREIYFIDIVRKGNTVEITFCGNGFLYNMVRILTGTLTEIGQGKRNISTINDVFETNDRRLAGVTLPARGLTLEKVFYNREEMYEYINGR